MTEQGMQSNRPLILKRSEFLTNKSKGLAEQRKALALKLGSGSTIMKTQLLEDIGQSGGLPPAPSGAAEMVNVGLSLGG